MRLTPQGGRIMGAPARVLVTGAGGFIGHHLVERLKADGHWVRGADVKLPEFGASRADEFELLDLRCAEHCRRATRRIDLVYNLAADVGGIGYVGTRQAEIARNNTLINVHMLDAARAEGVQRFLFSSSACVYPQFRQTSEHARPLREVDAVPADPEPGYGWEKLYTEQLCAYYTRDHGLDTRCVRFQNVYGPLGTYDGGREKAPAAISRKVASARDGDTIEVWGDGKQTRSFTYVDDCVEGLLRIMESRCRDPLNLGTDRLVTIDELVDLVCAAAGKRLVKRHVMDRPQGVRGRNSDNTKLREVLGWEPSISLEQGLAVTYRWIEGELVRRARAAQKAIVPVKARALDGAPARS